MGDKQRATRGPRAVRKTGLGREDTASAARPTLRGDKQCAGRGPWDLRDTGGEERGPPLLCPRVSYQKIGIVGCDGCKLFPIFHASGF